MGHGIAWIAARAGYDPCLVAVDPQVLERGLRKAVEGLEKAVQKGRRPPADFEPVRACLKGFLAKALAGVDLVVEAAPGPLSR